MSKGFFFNSETPPLDDGPDDNINIDLLNDETFGSGAVDEDWENEHNKHAQLKAKDSKLGSLNHHLNAGQDEDELELCNQQLAAAIEELVLTSDQDQDAIDPAIVSLRKESRPGSYDPRLTENLISPYMGERDAFSQSTHTYSSQSSSSSLYQSDGMRNIWSSTDAEVQETLLSKSPSMQLERQKLNEKLKNMLRNTNESPPFEDEAILSAVKTSSSGSWPISSLPPNITHHMFVQNPPMLRAEDLEKEYDLSELRGPSPTFGISIPKERDSTQEGIDRALPARSVSPIFGSPTAHAMPIGTPPKHIAEIMHHGGLPMGMSNRHPMPHPNYPHPMSRPIGTPPRGFFLPPGHRMPPPGGMMMPPRPWPPQGMMNRASMNPVIAQDIMNRLGITGKKQFSMMAGSPPANMSPIGSPRLVQAPRMIHPNVGFNRSIMGAVPNIGPPPPGFRGPMHGPFPNQRFDRPPRPLMYMGPGHLHPEHSRFVRMRRQQNSRNRSYGNQHSNNHNHRGYGREGPGYHHSSFLMSNREKDWVIKIQMMALQSDRPEIDDYYYQHYIEKRLREGGLSLDEDTVEQRRLITPTKTNPDNKKYVPVQFDNSLGKLTVSSVYNPRQIIDVVHKEDEAAADAIDSKMSLNKRLEIYKHIEKSYFLIMVLEELHTSLEDQTDMGEDEKRDKEQSVAENVKSLEDVLLGANNTCNKEDSSGTETISKMLKIRKGKRLICRALPLVSKNLALVIIHALIKQLSLLIKRDQREDILRELYHPTCDVLKEVDSDKLSQVCASLVTSLPVTCKDKFGLSLVCKVLSIGHTHTDLNEKASDNGKTWHNFVSQFLNTVQALAGQGDSSMPNLLEKDLALEVVSVLESYGELPGAEVELTSSRLKSLKSLLTSRAYDGDEDARILGTKRLPEV